MKIIIIDDEYSALSTFMYHVTDDYGIEVKTFMSEPLSAVRYVRENAVDGAFIDIKMPQLDGVSLAEKILAANPEVKIAFVTGYCYDEKQLSAKFGNNFIGVLEKPFSDEKLREALSKIPAKTPCGGVFIKTFGTFDVFLRGTPVKFTSSKSKELFALLADRRGASVSMGEAISCLWPNKDATKSKILYRDAVWRLRKTLSEYGICELVNFGRAVLSVNAVCRCDLWAFQDGETKDYRGEYMSGYGWSIITQSHLDTL